NFELARTHLEQAFRHYHRSDGFSQIYEAQGDMGVGALAYLALILWNLGYADESRDRSDLSLELTEEVGGPVTRAQAWGMRCILLADLRLTAGNQPQALEALRAGRAHIIETGERFSESELLRFMGRALMAGDAPDAEAATAAYEQAIAAAADQNAKLLELRAV